MEHALDISSTGDLVGRPGLWDQTKKPILLAAVALAVGALASRPRKGQRGSGVVGTVVKGALYGALSAIPQIVLLRLSNKLLGHQAPTRSADSDPVSASP